MGELLELVADAALIAGSACAALWMAGAIYFDLCDGKRWGRAAALVWLAATAVMLAAWRPVWQPAATILGGTVLFLLWWLRLRPSHDREWDAAVAVLPKAVRDGDVITFENVRNFEYRSADQSTPRYEARTVRLSNLAAADVIFFNWGSRLMSHPVVVFDFGPDGRICVSIEVRYRKEQKFSILRSLYRQQEIIFLVADERDAILRRTKFDRPQAAHLYRLVAEPDEVRAAFLDYVATINRIYDSPQWYHGICANCTTSFYRLPSRRMRLDWRVLANARLDEALYKAGRLDQSLPFARLREAAFITAIANDAPAEGFGDHIRREIERRRHA